MDKPNTKSGCGCESNGVLCNCALGIATVPCQQWKEVYDTKRALKQGTIFPELDLEFFLANERGGSL